jgi:hypothetical protein
MSKGDTLHSLIPLADFKAFMGIDDREDALCRFCLVAATCSIESYCGRRLLLKKHTERLAFYGGYHFYLKEYPVRGIVGASMLRLCPSTSLRAGSATDCNRI